MLVDLVSTLREIRGAVVVVGLAVLLVLLVLAVGGVGLALSDMMEIIMGVDRLLLGQGCHTAAIICARGVGLCCCCN